MRLVALLAPVLGATALLATALPTVAHADSTADGSATTSATATASTKGAAPALRFSTFNVRTSRADIGTSRHWLKRALTVAREIKTEAPDVVAIQELGPGRADGKAVKIGTADRQTESLLKALDSVGAGHYKLVRTTAYIRPGTTHGTQGTRILYNTNRVTLISNCPETTGKLNYNPSCSMDMPRLGTASTTRSAAYAELEDRKTGENFFAVSVHLDDRHSSNLTKERRLDSLRKKQVTAVYNRVSGLANGKTILWGGDINSWKTKKGSHAPYNFLTSKGFNDATNAATKTNASYPTVNHFKTTLKANAAGRQVALDVVMVKGTATFNRYENVMKPIDTNRASDHNMIITDLTL